MTHFNDLGLSPELTRALETLGYETPTPVQTESIPLILEGRDILAQAQTGTGKTGAFALPVLSKLDMKQNLPQVLVLAPTRELAIQVAEAFQSYAQYMKNFHVVPIYGGQDYRPQLQALKRGVQVVVGTPGRIMDHLKRGSLKLDQLKHLILDEADEMLKMGFVDDIEWIMEHIPDDHQTALFSATMPTSIRNITKRYLNNPAQVKIKVTESTVKTIKQFFVQSPRGGGKLEVLTRFLDYEDFDAAIIFARTKLSTSELASRISARGYACAAINGDMPQNQREKVIARLKNKELDIIVATDVAARGLDVERLSFVINYDISSDVESYVHRIGRTGRAGREGKALLFVAPRERRMLKEIERHVREKITELKVPSPHQVQEKRLAVFAEKVTQVLTNENLNDYRGFVTDLTNGGQWSELDIAAALTALALPKPKKPKKEPKIEYDDPAPKRTRKERRERADDRFNAKSGSGRDKRNRKRSSRNETEVGMTRCRIEVGSEHGLNPSDVVGLIANRCDLSRKVVGRIQINDRHSLVDLDSSYVDEIAHIIYRVKLKKQQTKLTPVER